MSRSNTVNHPDSTQCHPSPGTRRGPDSSRYLARAPASQVSGKWHLDCERQCRRLRVRPPLRSAPSQRSRRLRCPPVMGSGKGTCCILESHVDARGVVSRIGCCIIAHPRNCSQYSEPFKVRIHSRASEPVAGRERVVGARIWLGRLAFNNKHMTDP